MVDAVAAMAVRMQPKEITYMKDAKKPYTQPELEKHGQVQDVTAGGPAIISGGIRVG